MIAPIKLYHFGEPLVAALIDKIGLEGFYAFLRENSLIAGFGKDLKLIEAKINLIREALESYTTTETMIKFEHTGFSFDSEHSVDVGIVGKTQILPIEVKLGTSGKITSWSKFLEEEIHGRRIEIKGKEKATLKGSVPAFLAQQIHESLTNFQPKMLRTKENYSFIDTWCLCVRHKVFYNYENNNSEIILDIKHCPLVFCFEDLIGKLHLNDQKKLFQKIWKNSQDSILKEIASPKSIKVP